MSGNRAQRALLGTTRPRLVGLHVESGQLVVLKLDAIRCAWLKWTRKVQDVQQVFQLKRRMGHATLTQLTLQFFPQGGTDHFSDIFLFQVRGTPTHPTHPTDSSYHAPLSLSHTQTHTHTHAHMTCVD